jgi:hypothetical protein
MRRLFAAAVLAAAWPAAAQEAPAAMPGHDIGSHDLSGMDKGAGHDMTAMPGMSSMSAGALGPYAMTREASGTSWQPDVSPHAGLHVMAGPWMLMGHATINGVYDWQGGGRGDRMGFISGMAMGMARRDLGAADTLQLRAMLSPDPLMGKRGYPLLLAAGETADGRTPLVVRQLPHDLFM